MKIEVQSISHNRGEERLLRNISFTVESGETVVISGPSANGKSLLFSILCGLFAPDKGQVLVEGKNIQTLSQMQNKRLRKQFAAVFQRPALISNLSLWENFLLPLNLHLPYCSTAEKSQQVETLAAEFGLTPYLGQRTDVLSVGQAALAGFMRGILLKPKCLVWDAPFIEMDSRYEDVVKSHLLQLKQSASTIILMSNEPALINNFADTHYVLSEGILRQHDVK